MVTYSDRLSIDRCCVNLQPRFVTRPVECDERSDVVRRNARRKARRIAGVRLWNAGAFAKYEQAEALLRIAAGVPCEADAERAAVRARVAAVLTPAWAEHCRIERELAAANVRWRAKRSCQNCGRPCPACRGS